MIKKVKPNIYIVNNEDLCGENIIFIRESPEVLHHICDKEVLAFKKGERYLVGQVRWDHIEGEYFCDQCWKRLELADVWSDPEFTGCEKHS
jgi:hypothetical protein